jgi:hypothetical protein
MHLVARMQADGEETQQPKTTKDREVEGGEVVFSFSFSAAGANRSPKRKRRGARYILRKNRGATGGSDDGVSVSRS